MLNNECALIQRQSERVFPALDQATDAQELFTHDAAECLFITI
jgi:hypothetical protein